jgi:hypothetical protein
LRGYICANLTGSLAGNRIGNLISDLSANVNSSRRVLCAIGCRVCFAQLLGDG